MTKRPRVAVVKCSRRRDGVAEALALLRSELAETIHGDVVIKPNLVSHRRALPSTHRDTLSVVLDFARASQPRSITIAEGASDASLGFTRFGYRSLVRDERLFDLNRDETQWDRIELAGTEGETRRARLSRTIASADCRISLAIAKTHGNTLLTLSLKNMLSSIHPDDRVMMHGYAPGQTEWRGWRGALVRFLKGEGAVVTVATRILGGIKRAKARAKDALAPGGRSALTPADRRFLKSYHALSENLAGLSAVAGPHIAVIDGFRAMHGEGPRHGAAFPLGVIIAGANAVAADAVAAAVMGMDPREILHLQLAAAAGLGPADLQDIEIVGDPVARVAKKLRPHSHYGLLRRGNEPENRKPAAAPHVKMNTHMTRVP